VFSKENTGKFSTHAGALITNYKWLSVARSKETFTEGKLKGIKMSNGERHDASTAGPIRGK
jgi:hypothetical protein